MPGPALTDREQAILRSFAGRIDPSDAGAGRITELCRPTDAEPSTELEEDEHSDEKAESGAEREKGELRHDHHLTTATGFWTGKNA